MRASKVFQLIALTMAVTAVMLFLKSDILSNAVGIINKYLGQRTEKFGDTRSD